MAYPRVEANLAAWPLNEFARGPVWLIGSEYLDRYLTVPRAYVDPIHHALTLLDGTRPPAEVARRVEAKYAMELDVERLLERCREAGLLASAAASSRHSQGVASTALPLGSFSLSRPVEWIIRYSPWIPTVWFALLTAGAVFSLFPLMKVGTATTVSRVPFFPFLIACILSLLAHEASHGLAALRCGLKPASVSFALYLGFVPMLYLRLPGIYLRPRAERLRIWIAGCACNGAIATISSGVAHLPVSDGASSLWIAVAKWNYALICFNLIPFLATDGYFLVSTVAGEPNLRSRAWQQIAALTRGRVARECWQVNAFIVGSAALVLVAATRMARWGDTWTVLHRFPLHLGWLVAIAFISATFVWRNLLRRLIRPRWCALGGRSRASSSSGQTLGPRREALF